MKTYDVLIVEDDAALSEALCDTLELEGYRILAASNGIEALNLLGKCQIGLVISDVQMPAMGGLQLLQNLKQNYPDLPVLLITAYSSVPGAVEAMQAGASDYLAKPFEAETLMDKVAQLLATTKQESNSRLATGDEKMQQLYALVDKVAKTSVTMLIEGESGTGKEVMARYIHQNSQYRAGSFEAINCAAIPENMLEAMLFGYEKGAFTGAQQSMPGKFEYAQGGTVLLDEISEMDLGLQAKLLRVLQEKEVERLGSHRKITLNVRVLATTNRRLKDAVRQGRFREDLYFRLSVFPIRIPPLRERKADIPQLAQALLAKHAGPGKHNYRYDQHAMAKLQAYPWPGNVRELENVVQRALILHSNNVITVDDLVFEEDVPCIPEQTMSAVFLPEAERHSSVLETTYQPIEVGSLDEGVRSAEETIILKMLKEARGCRKTTAEKLGISPRTLRYKIARMKEAGVLVPG